jgi:hypothetical protein
MPGDLLLQGKVFASFYKHFAAKRYQPLELFVHTEPGSCSLWPTNLLTNTKLFAAWREKVSNSSLKNMQVIVLSIVTNFQRT